MLAVFHLFPVPELGAPKKSAMTELLCAPETSVRAETQTGYTVKALSCAVYGWSPIEIK